MTAHTPACAGWARPEDSRPTALHYDASRRRLVTAFHAPVAWAHAPPPPPDCAAPALRAVLHNSTFGVLVAGSEGGRVSVWDLATGQRQSGFTFGTSGARLEALALDAAQRRLLAGSDRGARCQLSARCRRRSGCCCLHQLCVGLPGAGANWTMPLPALVGAGDVRMYNFSSGRALRCFAHKERSASVAALAFVPWEASDAAQVEAGGAASPAGCSGPGSGDAASPRPGPEHSDTAFQLLCGDSSCSPSSGSEDEEEAPPRGVVWAAGRRGMLCFWLDGAEEPTCQRLRGHSTDVLCVAHCPAAGLVATGACAERQPALWQRALCGCAACEEARLQEARVCRCLTCCGCAPDCRRRGGASPGLASKGWG
jgi:hypothetical protein